MDPIKERDKLFEKTRHTPGLGEYMMKLAGDRNVYMANILKFGFYVGHKKRDKGLLKLTDRWPPW